MKNNQQRSQRPPVTRVCGTVTGFSADGNTAYVQIGEIEADLNLLNVFCTMPCYNSESDQVRFGGITFDRIKPTQGMHLTLLGHPASSFFECWAPTSIWDLIYRRTMVVYKIRVKEGDHMREIAKDTISAIEAAKVKIPEGAEWFERVQGVYSKNAVPQPKDYLVDPFAEMKKFLPKPKPAPAPVKKMEKGQSLTPGNVSALNQIGANIAGKPNQGKEKEGKKAQPTSKKTAKSIQTTKPVAKEQEFPIYQLFMAREGKPDHNFITGTIKVIMGKIEKATFPTDRSVVKCRRKDHQDGEWIVCPFPEGIIIPAPVAKPASKNEHPYPRYRLLVQDGEKMKTIGHGDIEQLKRLNSEGHIAWPADRSLVKCQKKGSPESVWSDCELPELTVPVAKAPAAAA